MLTANQRVCAVVVTYHPGREVTQHLASLRPQVAELVVVDNGSSDEAVQMLRDAGVSLNFKLIEAGENLGIGAAQNLGVRWAESQGCDYVIFFDQDSGVPEGFVDSLAAVYRNDPQQASIAVVVPRYRDRRLGIALPARYTSDGNLELAISSGSLVPVSVLRALGGFEESFIINYVDFDFALRARAAGYVLRECPDTELAHAPGDPQRYKLFGIFPVISANYGVLHRYYRARNLVRVVRRHGRRFPRICFRFVINVFTDIVKIVLVEPDSWARLRASLRGIVDGLRGRMGRTFVARP